MQIVAGGGVVTLFDFILGGGFACLLTCLFVLAGRGLLFPLNMFQQKIAHIGHYYFMGLCQFFVVIKLLTLMGLSFTQSSWLSLVFLLAVSLIPYYKQPEATWSNFLKTSSYFICWASIIGYLALFLLNIIARGRGGPIYAEVAEYIVATNSLPLLNRHYGQSILGALILDVFIKPNLQLARMGVNLWLPLSQIFLVLIIYSLTENIVTKKINRIMVCVIAFAGNCALSLLPHIPSDHDFPLIFNIYPDSVIGLGISVVALEISVMLIKNLQLKVSLFIFAAYLLYILLTTLNITSELNLLVITSSLVPIFIITLLARKNWKYTDRITVIFLAIGLAAASCTFMGGIFMPKKLISTLDQVNQQLFSDSNANSSIGNITATKPMQWYLPFVTPGFYKNFGNYESIFDGALIGHHAFNDQVMHIQMIGENRISDSMLVRGIYLVETRLGTIIKVLFWPIIGWLGCIQLLRRSKWREDINGINGGSNLLTNKEGLSFSIITFLIGLSVILLNSYPGDALFWKWALTRLNEIGIFLMMIYLGVFCSHILEGIKKHWVRCFLTIGLISLACSGVIIRLAVYSSFNG